MIEHNNTVVLIWTPFDIPNINFLPLGYGSIASNISPAYNLHILDYVLDEFSEEDLIRKISKLSPALIGISIWEINLQTAHAIVALIKTHFPEIKIVLGGPSASSRRNGALDIIQGDYALKGEGERSFEILCNAVVSGRGNDPEVLDVIPGIVYYNQHQKCYIDHETQPLDLANIKFPDYERIRIQEYIRRNRYCYGFFSKDVVNAPIITTRGCPYPCAYCSARTIHGTRLRTRLVKSIIEEIRYLYETYGVRGINIIDDNFTYSQDFAIALCREIIANKSQFPGLLFGTPNGVRMEKLNDELLGLMKQAGWEYITIAPESGNVSTLARMRKSIKLDEVALYVQRIKKFNLKIFAFFIIGYPGETIADVKNTIRFACRLPFDQITFSPFNPLPGTPVYEELLSSGEIGGNYNTANYFSMSFSPAGMALSTLKRLYYFALFRSIVLSPKRLFFLLSSYSFRRIFSYAKFIIARNANDWKKFVINLGT